jgi:ABC-2 type transport system ATP-binding protein
MIEAEELTKRRGGRTVVSDVTFRCEPGTVTVYSAPRSSAWRGEPRTRRLASAALNAKVAIRTSRLPDVPEGGRPSGPEAAAG